MPMSFSRFRELFKATCRVELNCVENFEIAIFEQPCLQIVAGNDKRLFIYEVSLYAALPFLEAICFI